MRPTSTATLTYAGAAYRVVQTWDEGYPVESIRYMWTEGNYGCDCNRSLFIQRQCDPTFLEMPCGGVIQMQHLVVDDVPLLGTSDAPTVKGDHPMQLEGATELEKRLYKLCLRVEENLPASTLATNIGLALSEAGTELQRLRGLVERQAGVVERQSAVVAAARALLQSCGVHMHIGGGPSSDRQVYSPDAYKALDAAFTALDAQAGEVAP